MSRLTSPTPIKKAQAVKVGKSKEYSNQVLINRLSQASYDFCLDTVYSTDNVRIKKEADELLQLMYEGLDRIFKANGEHDVKQFKVYETIELLFDNQIQYDTIKSLSGLKRIVQFGWEIDPNDEKYNYWITSRIKAASLFVCNKLEMMKD